MTLLSILPSIVLALLCIAYVFWTQKKQHAPRAQSQLDHLRERKDVIYENLRDLNFEYRAGKYPAEDYNEQRNALENEAATVLARIAELEGHTAKTASVR
ncbi:MAG: hypothetical protein PW735_05285 [Acidobacteriaceae bacterium]|nr:hypothetical protein [Acidobacteriaceae bacterium]